MSKPWWKYLSVVDIGNATQITQSSAEAALELKALDDGSTMHESGVYGLLDSLAQGDELVALIESLGGKLLRKANEAPPSGSYIATDWFWEDGFASFSVERSGNIRLTLDHFDEKLSSTLIDKARSMLIEKKGGNGRAYMLGAGPSGLDLMKIGKASLPFIPENYIDTVKEGYDHVVKDLNSSDPCGRLIIFNGPPGGGKTFIVRALMDSVPDGIFIVIPSHMLTSIGSPELIPLLIRYKNSHPGCPLIIVAEDADQALSSRATDNISAISTILNLGAGILGDMIDVRIVATTNIPLEEVDDAVVRAGRLCKQIEINPLNMEHANKIYKRLTQKEGVFADKNDRYTLATIYKAAKEGGWEAPKKARPMGFNVDIEDEEFDFNAENCEQGVAVTVGTSEDLEKALGLEPGSLSTEDDVVDAIKEVGEFFEK